MREGPSQVGRVLKLHVSQKRVESFMNLSVKDSTDEVSLCFMLPLFLEFCANVWFEKPDYLDLTPAPKPVAF